MASKELEQLKSLLTEAEIITPASSSYKDESETWGSQCNKNPTLVLRPSSVQSLSNSLAFLNKTSLDFAVRSKGFGNASAKDVLISLAAFDEFSYDAENETLILGAGQCWGDYYKKMEDVAPDRTVVACRTPSIGVGGSTLCGGFSWLSGEFGCVSDPVNMLDAQVVKLDGSVVWASEEPDLLWALRGAVPGLGGQTLRLLFKKNANKSEVVTSFKFRVRPYTQKIWAGPILLPNTPSALQQIAEGIVSMDAEPRDPKVAMFLYLIRQEIVLALGGKDAMLVVHAFDANSEEHGRERFKWALKMEGAMDMTETKNLRGVSDMQGQ
jgi:FAD/FMN-containing dehydrogenase